jgi:hypothetical protein
MVCRAEVQEYQCIDTHIRYLGRRSCCNISSVIGVIPQLLILGSRVRVPPGSPNRRWRGSNGGPSYVELSLHRAPPPVAAYPPSRTENPARKDGGPRPTRSCATGQKPTLLDSVFGVESNPFVGVERKAERVPDDMVVCNRGLHRHCCLFFHRRSNGAGR